MKLCPKCNMNVDAISECPICGECLVDIQQSDCRYEKYKINILFLRYILKNKAFSVVCTVVSVVGLIVATHHYWYFTVAVCLLIAFMWIEALFKNLIFTIFKNIFTEEYLNATNRLNMYICGIFASILSFL